MLLKLIRYAILFLVFFNFPGFVLKYFNPVISSLLSYAMFGLILLYFILKKEWVFNKWMLILGMTFFGIAILSGVTYVYLQTDEIIVIIKYFIIIFGGYIVVRNTTVKELTLILMFGALSVFLQIFLLPMPGGIDYGRYSGFYLNPNSLGFICMMGYALSYGVQGKLRLLAQVVFSVAGFLTFSRTFLAVWILINIASIFINIKNLRMVAMGFGLFVGLLLYNEFLPKKNVRLEAMSNLITGESSNTSTLEKGGRHETWALFYDYLYNKPFFGNGLNSFGGPIGGLAGNIGPHNAFIKIMGEAGIIPLAVLLSLYGIMFKKALILFKTEPYLFLMLMAFLMFISTNHSYMMNEYLLCFSMWLQTNLMPHKPDIPSNA